MHVLDAVFVDGRGPLVVVQVQDYAPQPGDTLRRVRDGARWTIIGVERHAIASEPRTGDFVGLLLPFGANPYGGDRVEIEQGEMPTTATRGETPTDQAPRAPGEQPWPTPPSSTSPRS